MKIADLKKDMDAQFARVDEQFAGVDGRFTGVDAQFARVDARLEAIEARIQATYEMTRRHIDVWGEQMRTELKLYSEHSAAMLQWFDSLLAANERDHANFMRIFENHEVRITSLEPKSS